MLVVIPRVMGNSSFLGKTADATRCTRIFFDILNICHGGFYEGVIDQ
jgi:hypothetical protein